MWPEGEETSPLRRGSGFGLRNRIQAFGVCGLRRHGCGASRGRGNLAPTKRERVRFCAIVSSIGRGLGLRVRRCGMGCYVIGGRGNLAPTKRERVRCAIVSAIGRGLGLRVCCGMRCYVAGGRGDLAPTKRERVRFCAIAFRHVAYVVVAPRLRGLQRARKPRPYEGGTTAAGAWGRSSQHVASAVRRLRLGICKRRTVGRGLRGRDWVWCMVGHTCELGQRAMAPPVENELTWRLRG